jgi:uncharacterized membrane protein
LEPELQIDAIGQAHLAETAKWGMFLSILGFIGSAVIVIVALIVAGKLGGYRGSYGEAANFGVGTIMVVYLVIAIIYFFMSFFLYRFSSKMKTALQSTDQESLNYAFLNLKNLYKMMGIITIVYLALMVLGLIFGIGSSMMR